MATNKNIKECGWFYHAPAKRQDPRSEPVLVPAASQIPGLNSDLPPEDDIQRSLFRDTDTKYVRLAKSGGRQNLLQFKENPDMRKREPKAYPRNEWFYLEDNRLEEEEGKTASDPYQFTVPEYMYHEVFNPDAQTDAYERPRRALYGFDNVSAFEREGKGVTDKTVKLPEVIKPGYGVRSGKPLRMKKQPPAPAGVKTVQQVSAAKMVDDGRPRLKYLPMPEASDKTEKAKMSKLLSYTYDKEWHDEVRKWEYKQDRLREKHKQMIAAQGPQNQEPLVSEYNTTIGKSRPPAYQPQKRGYTGGSGHQSNRSTITSTTNSKRGERMPEKELFKMSKFKNVQSRVDQTMPKAMVAATH